MTSGIGRQAGATSQAITLLPTEQRAALQFLDAHADCSAPVVLSATPSSIGSLVKAICQGCGEIVDLTDFAAW